MSGSLAIMVPTMISPLIPFIKERGTLVFYKSTIEFNFYRIPPSRINPLVSRRYCGIAPPLMNSVWCDTFHQFLPIHRFWVVINREHWIPFARHPFSRCRRYSMASSKTSRHDVSWSSSPLDFSKCVLNSWREIPYLPLDDLCDHRQLSLTPCMPIQTWSCMSWYAFPWKGVHWYVCIITFSLTFVCLIFLVI